MNGHRVTVIGHLIDQCRARRFVEVGCKQGRVSMGLAERFPELEIFAVDPWRAVPNAEETYEGWDYPTIEREFINNMKPYGARVLQMKMLSVQAATQLRATGTMVDVVFIDAAHDYANVTADIGAWLPLVRPGGYLSGHDYQPRFPGVMRAVDEHFGRFTKLHDDCVWSVRR